MSAAFAPREDWCGECNGHGYATTIEQDRSGLVEERCTVCDGEGKMPAGCAFCERGMPLDAEGFCVDCSSDPVVEIGDGWFGVRAA